VNITVEQYFGNYATSIDATDTVKSNADALLVKVNALITHMTACGVRFQNNPVTGSLVSGVTYGGFRPQNCTQGVPESAHKTGQAVDIYDPRGDIDKWLLTNEKLLDHFELWFEHPDKTPNWCHMGTRKPKSGNRFFYP
jgi:hypothetical protein